MTSGFFIRMNRSTMTAARFCRS